MNILMFSMPDDPPRSGLLSLMPGTRPPIAGMFRPVGNASKMARDMVCTRPARRTSPAEAAPDTVTRSASVPTVISTSMVAVKSDGSAIPSRARPLNPESLNVTVYPGFPICLP